MEIQELYDRLREVKQWTNADHYPQNKEAIQDFELKLSDHESKMDILLE